MNEPCLKWGCVILGNNGTVHPTGREIFWKLTSSEEQRTVKGRGCGFLVGNFVDPLGLALGLALALASIGNILETQPVCLAFFSLTALSDADVSSHSEALIERTNTGG